MEIKFRYSSLILLSCILSLGKASPSPQDPTYAITTVQPSIVGSILPTTASSAAPTPSTGDFKDDIIRNVTVLDIYQYPGSFRLNDSVCNVTQAPIIKTVGYFVSNGYAVVDGDIIYGPEAELLAAAVSRPVPTGVSKRYIDRRSYSITPMSTNKWQGGNVYYYFNAALPVAQRNGFIAATKIWKDRLPFLNFINQKNAIAREIVPIPGRASFSPIGCCGRQLQMGTGTSSGGIVPVTVHEIGHTLGLIHEHKRPDRNFYINIDFTNIQPSMQYNFAIDPPGLYDWAGPYDINSIMHYNDGAFALDSFKPVITGANGVFFSRCCRLLPTPQDLRHVCEVYWEYCHSICGDGVLSPQFEQCDDGNNIDGDGCSSDCKGTTCGVTSTTCTAGATSGPKACGFRATCQDFDAFGSPSNFGKDFCVCQAGYRATGVSPTDAGKQHRMTWVNQYGDQTHRVFVRPGQDCGQLCDEGVGDPRDCSEVPLKNECR